MAWGFESPPAHHSKIKESIGESGTWRVLLRLASFIQGMFPGEAMLDADQNVNKPVPTDGVCIGRLYTRLRGQILHKVDGLDQVQNH